MNIRLAVPTDIPAFLALQDRHLFANLNEAERQQGFVTTPFTTAQLLQSIEQEKGLYVAYDGSDLVAYAFGGSWQYFTQWEIFQHMVSLLPNLQWEGVLFTVENSYQYGPICVDHPYRGTGLAQAMFGAVRAGFSSRYPLGLTFINQINAISYHFHTQKLSLATVDTFSFNSRNYFTLAFHSI